MKLGGKKNNDKLIKAKIIRDIRILFKQEGEKDKPKGVN